MAQPPPPFANTQVASGFFERTARLRTGFANTYSHHVFEKIVHLKWVAAWKKQGGLGGGAAPPICRHNPRTMGSYDLNPPSPQTPESLKPRDPGRPLCVFSIPSFIHSVILSFFPFVLSFFLSLTHSLRRGQLYEVSWRGPEAQTGRKESLHGA